MLQRACLGELKVPQITRDCHHNQSNKLLLHMKLTPFLSACCRYSARAAAANAIYDEICAWDQRLTASLGLSDPRKLAMLHRAEAQVELQICNARLHRASQPPDKGTGAAVEPGPNSPATAALPGTSWGPSLCCCHQGREFSSKIMAKMLICAAGAHQGPVNRTGALAKDPQNAEALGRLRLAAKVRPDQPNTICNNHISSANSTLSFERKTVSDRPHVKLSW